MKAAPIVETRRSMTESNAVQRAGEGESVGMLRQDEAGNSEPGQDYD